MASMKKITHLCLGATNSGKTLLLRKLQGHAQIDETISSVPTVGSTIYKFKLRNASGVLLYTILTESSLHNAKILIVLSKMDMSYRQMRNEALLILQMEKLKREIPQQIEVVEFSATQGTGVNQILSWLE